jgi:hypothetical protein
MSLVRLFFNPLDYKSCEEHQVEPGTQIIEWLQDYYPDGFDGYLRVFAGTDEIDVDDLDYVIKDDQQITMLIMPSDGGVITGYLIQAAIAFAIGYVINLIFAPDTPGQPRADEESSVYSLSPTRNAARLGEPVEVVYGRVSYPPSFASVPYTFNVEESNDQFVDEILCLGQGYFDIEKIYFGEAPDASIEQGAVQYWKFGPDDHNSTAGTIESSIWNELQDTESPFRFYENVYTSTEVSGFEFRNERTTSAGAAGPFNGSAFAEATNASGRLVPGHIANIDTTLLNPLPGADPDFNQRFFAVGDKITLTGTASNNITFIIQSVVQDDVNPDIVTIYQRWDDAEKISNEDPLPGGAQYEANSTVDSDIAGPYRCQKEGKPITEVICDFEFPQGLFHRDGTDGTMKDSGTTMKIIVQEIDIAGTPIGVPIEVSHEFRAKTQHPYRGQISSGPLTPGLYEVSATKTSAYKDWRTTENVKLTGVKGIVQLDTTVGATYGPVTLLCVRMKATNGLAEAARGRIRVIAKRVLDPLDLTIRSDNPATAIKDVYTNTVYGLGRPLSEMDTDTIDAIEADWQVDGYGPRCNGAFDQRDTGYHAMQVIASMTGSKIVNDAGFVTLVQEKKQQVRKALFNSANAVRDSFELIYNFDTQGEFDGIEVEWRDPDTFVAQYSYYPETPQPVTPDTMVLWGVTSETYAEEMARYFYNVKDKRRKLSRMDVELDGWLVKFGDRYGLSIPMVNTSESGVVVEVINATTVRVDRELNWLGNDLLMLRDDQARPDGPYSVTQGATADIVIFSPAPAIPIYDMESREPSSYVFGQQDSLLMDFVVSKVSPQGETIFTIEGQTYDDAIYDGAPPHMGDLGAGYIEPLLISEEDFTGFTSNTALIATNPQDPLNPDSVNDGQRIIVTPTGSSWSQASSDGGVTWGSKVQVDPIAPTATQDITYLNYNSAEDYWYLNWYDTDGKSPYMYGSGDDGATWSRITDNQFAGYSYGVLIDENLLKWSGGRADSSGTSPAYIYSNTPYNVNVNTRTSSDNSYVAQSPYNVSWSIVEWGQHDGSSQSVCGLAEEGSNETGIIVAPGHSINGPYEYVLTGHSVSRMCSKGDDRGLILKNVVGSVATYSKMDISVLPANPFSEVSVDFGFNIYGEPAMCYAAGPDVYMCVAFEESPNQHILHIAYADASSDLSEWTTHPPINATYGKQTTDRYLHIVWAYDDTYYIGYNKGDYSHSGVDNFIAQKMVLFVDNPNPPLPVSHTMANWEQNEVNVVTQGQNFDHMSFSTNDGMYINSTDPLVGTYNVWGNDGTQPRGWLAQNMALDPWDFNNFTVEFDFRVIEFWAATGVPLFRYGSLTSGDEHIQAWVRQDGGLEARRYTTSTDIPWRMSTAAGTIVLGQKYTIRVAANAYHAGLWLDGVLLEKDRHAGPQRTETGNNFYLGAARDGGTADDQNLIGAQSDFDNLRVSHGIYPFENYTPEEYFAPAKPIGTLHKINFEADVITPQVGEVYINEGGVTHNTSSPLWETGSAEFNGTDQYLRSHRPDFIPHHFTMQVSFRIDAAADLALPNPIWSYGWPDHADFRIYLSTQQSGAATEPGKLSLYYENDNIGEVSIFSSTTIDAGTKYDVAVDFWPDGGGNIVASLYVNGTREGQVTFLDTVVYMGGPEERIGYGFRSTTTAEWNHFHGTIDEYKLDSGTSVLQGVASYTPNLPHP